MSPPSPEDGIEQKVQLNIFRSSWSFVYSEVAFIGLLKSKWTACFRLPYSRGHIRQSALVHLVFWTNHTSRYCIRHLPWWVASWWYERPESSWQYPHSWCIRLPCHGWPVASHRNTGRHSTASERLGMKCQVKIVISFWVIIKDHILRKLECVSCAPPNIRATITWSADLKSICPEPCFHKWSTCCPQKLTNRAFVPTNIWCLASHYLWLSPWFHGSP